MKNFVHFWKKDFINKLIVFVLFLLLAGVGAFVYMITHIPGEKNLGGMLSQFMISPTPTTDVQAVFTGLAQTAIVESTPAYLRGPATITPINGGVTLTITQVGTPTGTLLLLESLTPTPTPTLLTSPTPTPGSGTIAGVACLPAGTPKTGQVLDILDGVSIKVMIDDLVYTIHYIGVDLPAITGYAEVASMLNGNLVYQRSVQLYEDPAGIAAYGPQYRYIVVDGKLVNLELIKLGLVNVVDVPSGFACHQAFLEAENAARAAKVGQWK